MMVPARAEAEVTDTDAHLWQPLTPHQPRPARDACRRGGARSAWSVVRVEFKRALALRSEIRRAGWFN
jgi:hypothetical protein